MTQYTTEQIALFKQAAEYIAQADGLIIAAGAGMGVDSGLPDFRGAKGFWKAYPALGNERISFSDIANEQAFRQRPSLAWGFYGHRLNLYREIQPHIGFQVLLDMAKTLQHGAFVYTSNVDGQFQKAGFSDSQICEKHGSIHYLQCLNSCTDKLWSANRFKPQVDEHSCMLTNSPPTCPNCGGLARPNILMFDDWGWQPNCTELQQTLFKDWVKTIKRGVVIEIGAGTTIPSIRYFSQNQGVPLIRINPTEPKLSGATGVSIAMGGATALLGIQEQLIARNKITTISNDAARELP
jgi:NAD-dependent SIR2 family protein deacetylase